MDPQIKNRFREIVAEAQYKVNSVCPGFRVVLVEAERTEADLQADIRKALQDRNAAGLSASNNFDAQAPARN